MSIDSYRNKELWKVPPNMARREATEEAEPIPHKEQIKHQASKILDKMKECGYINSKDNTPDSVGQWVSESPQVFDQRFKHSTTAGDVSKLSKGQKALKETLDHTRKYSTSGLKLSGNYEKPKNRMSGNKSSVHQRLPSMPLTDSGADC
jgi:hypothetical protein